MLIRDQNVELGGARRRSSRDLVIAAASKLDQTEPMTKWIGEDSDPSPFVGAHFTFESGTSFQRPRHSSPDLRNDEVEVNWSPVPPEIALLRR